MKIYTKGGDKGYTSLFSGKRVPKNHTRVEAYGTIDELSSFVGLLRSGSINQQYKEVLIEIQRRLFDISALLACDEGKFLHKLRKITDEDIQLLENQIDILTEKLPPLRDFILPGGEQDVATTHICRVVARRAERKIIAITKNENIDNKIIIYINRLSDYFFVLSRAIASDKGFEQEKV